MVAYRFIWVLFLIDSVAPYQYIFVFNFYYRNRLSSFLSSKYLHYPFDRKVFWLFLGVANYILAKNEQSFFLNQNIYLTTYILIINKYLEQKEVIC